MQQEMKTDVATRRQAQHDHEAGTTTDTFPEEALSPRKVYSLIMQHVTPFYPQYTPANSRTDCG